MDSQTIHARFLGVGKPYAETLALMHTTHEAVACESQTNQLLLLEHSPVITVTRQHMFKSIITSPQSIELDNIDLVVADRGGDATFHGPGQLVGYPIIKLDKSWRMNDGNVDIERYVRVLETSLLSALQKLGLTSAMVIPGFTGIWCRCNSQEGVISLKKLIAIGVGIKNGVSKHGFALNVDIDHQRFRKHIIPCGLKDRGIITLHEASALLGIPIPSYEKIIFTVAHALAQSFALHLVWHDEVFSSEECRMSVSIS